MEDKADILIGRNAVWEALRAGRQIGTIYLLRGGRSGNISRILILAKEQGVPIKEVGEEKLRQLAGDTPHQGVAAALPAVDYVTVEELFQKAEARKEAPFFLLADGIEDPHNLGAIIRTAEAAGAHGLILPRRRSAALTPAASKTSAGAINYLPVARVGNLVQTAKELQSRGVWLYGADMEGTDWCGLDYRGGVALVIGSEGKGISRLMKETCDYLVRLPMRGKVGSLNASVAAGVLMYEITRQRMGLPVFSGN